MPHTRQRWVEARLLKTLDWSPAVGIYGLRQVGKSTLVESVTRRKKGDYETFDRAVTLAQSQNRPEEFCGRPGLLCIDECQKGPWIFPVIKDRIGTGRRPGRFLLTGSIRFTLKKEIHEALTGRIVLFEMLPFTHAEALGLSPSPFLGTCFERLFETKKGRRGPDDACLGAISGNAAGRDFPAKGICRHLTIGGMPIPCFTREESRRKEWFGGFFETLITRDLALSDPSLSDILPAQGFSYLRRLALMQGEELNVSQLAASSALSLEKARRVTKALVALCLIDLIVPETHAGKSQKKMRVEWKDSGLWNHFARTPETDVPDTPAAMELFLAQEMRFQAGWLPDLTQRTYYRSHDGANVPWIFRQGKRTLALVHSPMETPRPYDYRSLKQFVGRESAAYGIILGPAKAPYAVLDRRILLMPYTAVL